MRRALAVFVLALTFAACSRGRATLPTTSRGLTTPPPSSATSSEPSAPGVSTSASPAAASLPAPEKVGPYQRVNFEGGEELARALSAPEVEASLFALYAPSADERAISYILVAARTKPGTVTSSEALLNSVVGAISGSG